MTAVVKYEHHFDLGLNRIGNLGTPQSATEAATKGYVDAAVAAALAALLGGLPTADPAINGAVWNNNGVLTASTGP